MQITLDDNKYNICKRKIQVVANDLIGWYDSDRLWRTGYFCREHKQLILKTLKLIAKG